MPYNPKVLVAVAVVNGWYYLTCRMNGAGESNAGMIPSSSLTIVTGLVLKAVRFTNMATLPVPPKLLVEIVNESKEVCVNVSTGFN